MIQLCPLSCAGFGADFDGDEMVSQEVSHGVSLGSGGPTPIVTSSYFGCVHFEAGSVLYVWKAKNLRQRLGDYRVVNPDRTGRRYLRLLGQVAQIELLECADELAALAGKAELLRALKPKFNRAGGWPATPRFLVWRWAGRTLELVISETPAVGWLVFGLFGRGAVFLRAALVRLLWYALNPASGATAMPQGWLHGRLGAIAAIEANQSGVDLVLMKLFEGDTDGFVA